MLRTGVEWNWRWDWWRLMLLLGCRAENSLAVVAYTDDPARLKSELSGKGWFIDDEIVLL